MNKKLFTSIPQDDSKKKELYALARYNDVSVVNVPARSAVNINLHNGMYNDDDNWNLLCKTNRIVLEYLNEKNKRRQVKVSKRKIKQ